MNAPVALKDIANRQGIDLTYLEQLFRKLRIAGIVKSIRGRNGGYIYASHPQTSALKILWMLLKKTLMQQIVLARHPAIQATDATHISFGMI